MQDVLMLIHTMFRTTVPPAECTIPTTQPRVDNPAPTTFNPINIHTTRPTMPGPDILSYPSHLQLHQTHSQMVVL
jgi:hypothetical protein